MSPDDEKLLALARSARARIGAEQGAAMRDETGRSYAGATVALQTLQLSALELAVGQAFGSGAHGVEGVVVVGGSTPDLAVVRDLGGYGVPVWHCDARGVVVAELLS